MPYKTNFPPLPFLDPEFDPYHPSHNLPTIDEDPKLPFTARKRKQLIKEQLEQALADYRPPHVLRSHETDEYRKRRYQEIMGLELHTDTRAVTLSTNRFAKRSGPHDSSPSRVLVSPHRPEEDPLITDFRQFAVVHLHLGYNRFHLSTDQRFADAEDEDTSEPEICWIMEYLESECNTIRHKIAEGLGIYPAEADPENPSFNEEIQWRYHRRLKSRCRRRNKRCVRPSHIEIFSQSGIVLP